MLTNVLLNGIAASNIVTGFIVITAMPGEKLQFYFTICQNARKPGITGEDIAVQIKANLKEHLV
jgi:hypothetical protein